jgi:hypothetical protein
MLYIVDGTGEWNNDEYEHAMEGGFCRSLQKKTGGYYSRGPSLTGVETPALAAKVAALIVKDLVSDFSAPIYLAGHSRGGAAVIWAAKILDAANVSIKAMFLFDAVDRTTYNVDLTLIPKNVLTCYHAMRDGDISSYYTEGVDAMTETARVAELRYGIGVARNKLVSVLPNTFGQAIGIDSGLDKKLADAARLRKTADYYADQDAKMKVVMRSSFSLTGGSIDFGNCGIDAEPGGKFISEKFLGSHGAMGGAPIIGDDAPKLMINADRAAMASVDAWMSGHLCREGVLTAGGIRK